MGKRKNTQSNLPKLKPHTPPNLTHHPARTKSIIRFFCKDNSKVRKRESRKEKKNAELKPQKHPPLAKPSLPTA